MSELQERDPNKPAEQQGVFRKFEVSRVDGSDQPGGKHHGCEYFVLDVTHDQHAKAALAAYADACKGTHPELSRDMIERYGLLHVSDTSSVEIAAIERAACVCRTMMERCGWRRRQWGDDTTAEYNICKELYEKILALRPRPATPTATASQESAPGQEALGYVSEVAISLFKSNPNNDSISFRAQPIDGDVPVYLATPTSTAIAAMVIQKALNKVEAKVRLYDSQMEGADHDDFIRNEWAAGAMRQLLKELRLVLNAANTEAELEALMMKVAEEVRLQICKAQRTTGDYYLSMDELVAIVRRVLDEMKGE